MVLKAAIQNVDELHPVPARNPVKDILLPSRAERGSLLISREAIQFWTAQYFSKDQRPF